MTDTQTSRLNLKDYRPSDYSIIHIDLNFSIHPEFTTVQSTLQIERRCSDSKAPLILNGEHLKLVSLKLDGSLLNKNQYTVDNKQLTLEDLPAQFALEVTTEIYPHENKSLEGFYQTGDILCTQNEPNGFRRITYFLDRFDSLSTYTTRIEADQSTYPVLLANGNKKNSGELADGRHYIVWEDPIPKNPNIFAMVAGDLAMVEDSFTTMSGRSVILQTYVDKGNEDRVGHTMDALKKAMDYDEKYFQREYDLDYYLIVAVDAFNFAAMENKGLNIFNSKAALASPTTASDSDFQTVEVVVVHEYLHNWTGNRISCRDPFQMTLKEGLTVFRDQRYSETTFSEPLERIRQVQVLRNAQFPEDGGPTAHPIRPASIGSANNIYTTTVYKKGAEVIRMIETLLGKKHFNEGLQLFFNNFDGKAACTEDFLQCMNEVSGFDFSQFENWYSQAGTPRLAVTDEYNEAEKAYTLTVRQSCPATPEAQVKKPFHLPLSLGLLDADGQDMSLTLEGEDESSTNKILEIRQDVQTFTFVNIDEKPTPSLLRHFSAPVKLEFPYSQDQLLFLLKHDSDAFNRYEAAQRLIKGEVDQLVHAFQENTKYEVNRHVLDALGHVLTAPAIDPAFKAELLQVPSVASLIEEMEMADFAAADFATGEFTKTFARTFEFQLSSIYLKLQADKENSLSQEAVAARSLKHCVLAFLISLETPEAIQFAWKQFYQAQNMTDEKSAMFLLAQIDCHENDKALRCFYSKWNHDQLVINSWFTCQAASKIPGALDRVKRLVKDACFDITNPNKIASLFTTLAGNLVQFHDKSGEVYAYIAQKILEIDRFNPSAASRLALVFKKYKTLNPHCKMLIKGEIDKLLADKKLSTNSRDHLEKIISK